MCGRPRVGSCASTRQLTVPEVASFPCVHACMTRPLVETTDIITHLLEILK